MKAGTFAWILFGIVLLVMVISAVNVANLLVARGAARVRELSTRFAIGAGRARIIRQLLTENALLGLFGLGAGLSLGELLIHAIPALIIDPPGFHMPLVFALDGRVLRSSVLLALATTVLFGLMPVLRVSALAPVLALRSADPAGPTRRRSWLRQSLVAVQVSISLTLLATAGVLVESFLNTETRDPGMTRGPRLVVWLSSPDSLRRAAIDQVARLPGVKEVAVAVRAPLSLSGGGIAQEVTFPDHPQRPGEAPPSIRYNAVSSNYFAVMGVRIVRGRAFSAADQTSGEPTVIISEAMAQRYWPGQDAVGKMVGIGGTMNRVVGMARNAPVNELGEMPDPYMYLPFWRTPFGEYTIIAATAQPDASVLSDMARRTLFRFDRRLEPMGVTTEADLIRFSGLLYRITAALVSALGLIGLVLTAVGLYAVVSWRVTQRRREIGIRMAIGAGGGETVRLVLRDTAAMGLMGFAMGVPMAMVATRLASHALFGVGPWDVRAFGSVLVLLAAVLLVAGFVPARRATRIDPLAALRCD